MSVADFVAFLQTQDQGATVLVIEHANGHTHYDQGGNVQEVPFNPAVHAYLSDYSSPAFAGKPYHGTRELLIGSRE